MIESNEEELLINSKISNESFMDIFELKAKNNSCLPDSKNLLRVMQLNVRGLRDITKFDNIKQFIQIYKNRIDIIVLTEHWLDDNLINLYNIPEYTKYSYCRKNSIGGGILVFVRSDLEASLVEKSDIEGPIEYIKISVKTKINNLDLIAIYRLPGSNIDTFFQFMENCANTPKSTSLMFVGDFNIAINRLENLITKRYIETLESIGLTITNNQITRICSSNVLDHVVCSMDKFEYIYNETIHTDLSDHSCIVTTVDLKIPPKKVKLSKKIVNYDLINLEMSMFLNNLNCVNPIQSLEEIIVFYNQLVTQHTKIIEVYTRLKAHSCQWFNFKIWKLSKIKSKLYKKLKITPNNNYIKNLLNHTTKKLKYEQYVAKKNYYHKLFDSSNQKSIWKNINMLLGKIKNSEKQQNEILVQDTIIREPTRVANTFNTFFTEIGQKLATSIKSGRDIDKFDTIKPISESFFFSPSNPIEVLKVIETLKNGKSPGPDNIPVNLVKEHKFFFANFLSTVFNFSVSSGIFPDILKLAKVVPVFKSGDPKILNNYRPISTLSVFNKVLESIVYNRLSSFLEKNNFFYKSQFGFRKSSGTTNSVIENIDYVLKELDKSNVVASAFLDLSKAFDTIDHKILLLKLEKYGIRGIALEFFKNYLSNRKQFVCMNGIKSSTLELNIGVPQGSNLGPLLFLIYINDISRLKLHGSISLFADDTAIFYSDRNPANVLKFIKDDLILLNLYFQENLLSLNYNKTKFMIFSSRKKNLEHIKSIDINGFLVQRVETFKFLGITIDDKLNWDAHINHILKSIAPLCGVLWKIRKYVPVKVLLSIYYSYIYSKLLYLSVIWCTASLSRLKPVQVLQNRCLKAIFGLPRLYNTRSLYENYKMLPLLAIYELQLNCHMYKILKNLTLNNYNFIVRPASTRLRRNHNLSIISIKTEKGRKSFSYSGPNSYNKLPFIITEASNYKAFRQRLKHHITNNLSSYII